MKNIPIILLILVCTFAISSVIHSITKKKDVPKDFTAEIERFESMTPAKNSNCFTKWS